MFFTLEFLKSELNYKGESVLKWRLTPPKVILTDFEAMQ